MKLSLPVLGAMALVACGTDVGITESARCDGQLQPGEETVDDAFDRDGDGYFDASNPDCAETWPADALDCDDVDPDVSPGADEVACDGVDNDCDPSTVDDDGSGCGASRSGTWTLDSTVAYSCGLGNVVIDFDRVVVDDQDPSLSVTPLGGVQPGELAGSVDASGAFDVQRVISGACTETYRLTGTFTGPDSLDASFQASFTGGFACVDCSAYNASFSATR